MTTRDAGLPPYLQLLLGPNPGPMTLQGTNTWLLGDPRLAPPVVVDPGPADEGHLARVLTAAGGRIAAILLTHRHADHSAGAPRLAQLAGCPVRAGDPAWRSGDGGLVDAQEVEVPGLLVRVVGTPGHTSDSVSLLVAGPDGAARLLTGDTVLGSGTTVIAEPDGDLAAYLQSLDVLARVVAEHQVEQLLPGHGPVVDDPAEVLEGYRAHRLARLNQVREALRLGDATAAQVVARVYAEVDRSLWPAAEQSVRAQLAYLSQHG